MVKKNIRDIVPTNVTPEQWEDIKEQADEWGAMFVLGCPKTTYIKESMCWDYSNNEEAVNIFGRNDNGECLLYMPFFARY